MTSNPFIDRNLLLKWRKRCKIKFFTPEGLVWKYLTAARVPDNSPLDVKGYFATDDGRICLRLVDQEEAQRVFRANSITLDEGVHLSLRLCQLFELEDTIIEAQRQHVIIETHLDKILDKLSTKEQVPDKWVIEAQQALRKIKELNTPVDPST